MTLQYNISHGQADRPALLGRTARRALGGAVAISIVLHGAAIAIAVLALGSRAPASEDPAAIRAAVLEGARTLSAANGTVVLEVGSRKQAIERAVQLAGPGDVVLVLGKGHEQGQEIAGTVLPFDDRVELAHALTAGESSAS